MTIFAPNSSTSQINSSVNLELSKVGTIRLGLKGKKMLHSIAKDRAHRTQTVARTVMRESLHDFVHRGSISGYKTKRSWTCLHTDATDVNLSITITDTKLGKKLPKDSISSQSEADCTITPYSADRDPLPSPSPSENPTAAVIPSSAAQN